jgi:WXG100 family type VII secretion target
MAVTKIVDEPTTVAMIQAFNECQSECTTIQGLVDSAQAQLMSTWGGQASAKYDASMHDWRIGFTDVQNALNMLDEAMVGFAKTTQTAEDDNVVRGSGWAQAYL